MLKAMKNKILQKILFGSALVALIGVLLVGCSKDEGPATDPAGEEMDVFMLDGVAYDVNLSYLTVGTLGEPKVNLGTVLITGGNGPTIASLDLPLAFALGDDIEGTYARSSDLASAGAFIGYMANYGIQNGADLTHGNYPTGYIKVTHHKGDEYTVEFDLVFADGVKASGKIRRDFTSQ